MYTYQSPKFLQNESRRYDMIEAFGSQGLRLFWRDDSFDFLFIDLKAKDMGRRIHRILENGGGPMDESPLSCCHRMKHYTNKIVCKRQKHKPSKG